MGENPRKTEVIPAREQTYLSTCPVCQSQIDVTALEPFTKLKCPFCGQMVRVRRKFDHFVIVRQIGEGGMSRVFEAEDETLGRRVALKILNRQYGRDASRVEQFRQEALITANVNHPNVIKLYSVGYDQGYFYIAMELVGGGSLEQRIRKEGSIKEREALKIGREVAEGLRAAQQLGLIHRDVKPANILFTETGTAKVVDFGLALFVERGPDASGEIWATPYYVAPEKVLDNREDYRSDIFSLGASLYHALTGRPPHKADTNSIEELRMIKCRRVALEDSGMRFAPRTVHVVNRMVAFRPQERCANYDETVEELRLAEGLVSQRYSLRLGGRRRNFYARIAAALLLLTFGIGWLVPALRDKHAAAITVEVDSVGDLSGDAVTPQSGRKTVSDRFLAARQAMLENEHYTEARNQFERLIDSGDARQPVLNWARFNAAVCGILTNKKADAIRHLRKVSEDTGEGNPQVTAGQAAFFKLLGRRMGDDLGLGEKLENLGYDTKTEAILGYLIHGLAEWHYGDALTGMADLAYFRAHLKDLETAAGEPNALDWVRKYEGIVKAFEPEMRLAGTLQEPAKPATLEEGRKTLEALQRAKDGLRTASGLRATVEHWEANVKEHLSGLRREREKVRLAEEKKVRQAELAQLAEATATLPSLVQGYDFSRVVAVLREMRFESAEVQSALEGRRYLYEQAQAFMDTLAKDVSTKGYTGRLHRIQASTLDGRATAMDPEKIVLSLERGNLAIPTSSLTPETLLDMAQSFTADVTDSTEYYQRQEAIAAFARVAGLHSLSATVAAQLMEENRSFRLRWMKVP